VSILQEIIAGGIAGATAKSCVAPLERCKILFQTGRLHRAGIVPTLTAIFRGEGVRGLFRGNGASVLRIIPYSSVHFGLYEQYRRSLVEFAYGSADPHMKGVSPFVDLLAGSGAGATAVLVTYPLDLVRTRLAFMTEASTLPVDKNALPTSRIAQAAVGGSRTRSGATSAGQVHAGGDSGGSKLAGGQSTTRSRGTSSSTTTRQYCSSSSSAAGTRAMSGVAVTGRAAVVSAKAGAVYKAPVDLKDIVLRGRSGGHQPPARNFFRSIAGNTLTRHRSRYTTPGACKSAASPPSTHAFVSLREFHLPAADPRHSIRGVLSSTLRHEGVRGLYHGIGPSMYGILPYAGLKFFVYQHLKQAYIARWGPQTALVASTLSNATADGSATPPIRGGGGGNDAAPPPSATARPRLPVPIMLACGGVAGLIAQTVTYPLDVVRRRMQVEGLLQQSSEEHFAARGGRLPSSTPAALVAIARRQGWRMLFNGLSINYMKVVPSTAIGFSLYDFFKAALDLPTHL
jgi:solute carrier family 25 (mitochondrial carrier protein), member 16